jgi:thymidylate synthase (FAD)
MFKTIHECGLELVAHTTGVQRDFEIDGMVCCEYPDVDMMPVRAARASFGKQDKTGEKPEADIKLMHFLAEHQHMTPFEYQHATFLIECPLFIRSQIHRHRTFAYNEISRRYTSENLEFWIPDKFRGQSTNNKQASSEEVITQLNATATFEHPFDAKPVNPMWLWETVIRCTLNEYQLMVDSGVAREIARGILPQSLLTRFYMGGKSCPVSW